MRNNFINNFQLGPTAEDDTSGGGFVDVVKSLASDAATVITALKGGAKTAVRTSSAPVENVPPISTTNNNTAIYILIAVAAMVGLYFYLKK